MAYTGMSNQNHSSFTSAAPKPVQAQSSWIAPYIKDAEQDSGATGQTGLSTLDMIARMNKIADKGATDITKQPGFSDAVYRFDKKPGESYEDAFKRSAKPYQEMILRTPGSGQDGGNKNWSDTKLINTAFNDYNRNAEVDKGKVVELASSGNDPVGDFFSEVGKGAENIWDNIVKFFEGLAKSSDNGNGDSIKVDVSKLNSDDAIEALNKANDVVSDIGEISGNKTIKAVAEYASPLFIGYELYGLYKSTDNEMDNFSANFVNIGAEKYNRANSNKSRGVIPIIPLQNINVDDDFVNSTVSYYNFIMEYFPKTDMYGNPMRDISGLYWDQLTQAEKDTIKNNMKIQNPLSKKYTDDLLEPVKETTINMIEAIYFK